MAKFYDTLLWEYIKNPWIRGLSLDDLSEKYFDYKMMSYKEITNNAKINFKDIDLAIASDYSVEDVYITKLLYDKQVWELSENDNKLLNEFDLPLMDVLKDIEMAWVNVCTHKLDEIWERLKIEIKALKEDIFNDAWEEFNINSPKQVWWILFDKLWLPATKKTKTWYSVSAQVLDDLALAYPIAKKIVLYRHYSKLLSTYIEGIKDIINPKTGRVHTNYNQTVTSTGRLSSTNPNMQNIPATSGIAWEIREAFIPYEKGDVIMWFDYSQVEVRLLWIMSWDEELISAYVNGEDIHDKTAKLFFGVDEVTSDQRRVAKVVNFGIIYWVSAFGLTQQVPWITPGEAKWYIDAFYGKYTRVKEYFDEVIDWARNNWYVETLFWRKRFISGINDRNKMVQKASEREAINTPIQWTAADVIKLAMIEVSNFLRENNMKSKMIIQVHDELVFNVPEWEIEVMNKEIPRIMEGVINEAIPLKVDWTMWKNWREAK